MSGCEAVMNIMKKKGLRELPPIPQKATFKNKTRKHDDDDDNSNGDDDDGNGDDDSNGDDDGNGDDDDGNGDDDDGNGGDDDGNGDDDCNGDDDDGNGDDEDDDKECKMTASMTTPTIGWWIVKNNDKIGLFPTLYSQEFGSEGNLYKSVPEGHKGTGVSSSK